MPLSSQIIFSQPPLSEAWDPLPILSQTETLTTLISPISKIFPAIVNLASFRMQLRLFFLALLALMLTSTTAAPVPGLFHDIWDKIKKTGKDIIGDILDYIADSVPSAGAPHYTKCTAEPLIRLANLGRSPREAEYVKARKAAADPALQQWLQSTGLNFSLLYNTALPMLAMTTSGGGLRSLLTGAGIHQAMDIREKDVTRSPLSGLLQAMTYEAGTSGGGWLLGSLGTNDWPTVSNLSDRLWIKNLQDGYLSMAEGRDHDMTDLAMDFMEVMHKHAAGFKVSFSDASGEILAKALLPDDNGVYTWSGMTSIPAYAGMSLSCYPKRRYQLTLSNRSPCRIPDHHSALRGHSRTMSRRWLRVRNHPIRNDALRVWQLESKSRCLHRHDLSRHKHDQWHGLSMRQKLRQYRLHLRHHQQHLERRLRSREENARN